MKLIHLQKKPNDPQSRAKIRIIGSYPLLSAFFLTLVSLKAPASSLLGAKTQSARTLTTSQRFCRPGGEAKTLSRFRRTLAPQHRAKLLGPPRAFSYRDLEDASPKQAFTCTCPNKADILEATKVRIPTGEDHEAEHSVTDVSFEVIDSNHNIYRFVLANGLISLCSYIKRSANIASSSSEIPVFKWYDGLDLEEFRQFLRRMSSSQYKRHFDLYQKLETLKLAVDQALVSHSHVPLAGVDSKTPNVEYEHLHYIRQDEYYDVLEDQKHTIFQFTYRKHILGLKYQHTSKTISSLWLSQDESIFLASARGKPTNYQALEFSEVSGLARYLEQVETLAAVEPSWELEAFLEDLSKVLNQDREN